MANHGIVGRCKLKMCIALLADRNRRIDGLAYLIGQPLIEKELQGLGSPLHHQAIDTATLQLGHHATRRDALLAENHLRHALQSRIGPLGEDHTLCFAHGEKAGFGVEISRTRNHHTHRHELERGVVASERLGSD